MHIIEFLNDNIIWGMPMLILMIGTGLLLIFITKGIIFSKFNIVMKYTLATLFKKKTEAKEGTITPFQAVSTALAATVGTGNIVGVAVAIQVGGPGAIFWMWVSAIIGMMTKYAEVLLAFAYKDKNEKGEVVGGPMYYITKGLGKKWFALIFCFCGIFASFGVGSMVQANALAGGVKATFGVAPWITGIAVAVLAGLVLVGGIKRISSVAEILVPFMALFYIVVALAVLVLNASGIPAALALIVKSGFTPAAASGGFLGATVMYAARIGVARGVFTNEAGLGSAPIAHAAADNDHPARQGLWGAFETFFDTIVMCTMTALVILTSGLWNADPMMEGNAMSTLAFDNAFNGGGYVVALGLVLFAFATIIAWYYYGEKCVEYMVGQKGIGFYRIIFLITVYLGCVAQLDVVWQLSDLFNGMMAIPNLIALFLLAPVVKDLTTDFFKDPDRIRPDNEDYSKFLIFNGKKSKVRTSKSGK